MKPKTLVTTTYCANLAAGSPASRAIHWGSFSRVTYWLATMAK